MKEGSVGKKKKKKKSKHTKKASLYISQLFTYEYYNS